MENNDDGYYCREYLDEVARKSDEPIRARMLKYLAPYRYKANRLIWEVKNMREKEK